MKYTKKIVYTICILLSVVIALGYVFAAGSWIFLNFYDGIPNRSLDPEPLQLRMDVVTGAKKWLGTQEYSEDHGRILAIYNGHEPLARGYTVTPDDNWCATYVSAVAIETGTTDLIPTECGCERQIELWKALGHWEEADGYAPLPGDYIYYNWDQDFGFDDNTGWSDHVGIVVGTAGPYIKVIEGNRDDCVMYRIILRGHRYIRGYGLPAYGGIG